MTSVVRLLIFLCLTLLSVAAEEPAKPLDSVATEAAVRDFLIKGLDAVSAKELDAPLAKFAALQRQMQLRLNSDPNAFLIRLAADIVTAYQDGLLGTDPPKRRSAIERMQQTASALSSSFADLMPRSELMEKIQKACGRISGESHPEPSEVSPEKRVSDLIRGIKKLEDMDSVMVQIDALESQMRQQGNMTNNEVITLFRDYCRTYHELRDGQATSLNFASRYPFSAGADVMVEVRDLLTRYALPRVLGTPADLVQKEGETTVGFLQRAITTARTTSNWSLLTRALEAAQAMRLDTVVSPEDSNGLSNFLGGLNQEQARVWTGAVTSYLSALKSGSQVIPVEYIGKRLEELRQQHPEDYDAGAKATPGPNSIEQRVGRPLSPFLNPQGSSLSVPALTKPAANDQPGR